MENEGRNCSDVYYLWVCKSTPFIFIELYSGDRYRILLIRMNVFTGLIVLLIDPFRDTENNRDFQKGNYIAKPADYFSIIDVAI